MGDMPDMWNQKNLPLPAISTYKTVNRDIDLNYLHNICNEFKNFFENDRYMEAEYLVLSRIVYRMKLKFRASKDFKVLEKLCKCLKIYHSTNLTPHLSSFIELIPRKFGKKTYLPSKCLMEFILVRLQGMVKLLERIVGNCKETAYLLNDRIKIGHFWKIGFILLSIVSRIYLLAKYTTNKICEMYGKLIPFSKKLQSTSKWLPEGYTLPSDLKQWLNVNWLDNDIEIIEESTIPLDIIKLYDLVEDSDIEFCDEYILINEESCNESEDLTTPPVITIDEDVGEIIEVEDNLLSLNFPKKYPKLLKRKMKREKLLNINKSDIQFKKRKKGKLSKVPKNKDRKEMRTN